MNLDVNVGNMYVCSYDDMFLHECNGRCGSIDAREEEQRRENKEDVTPGTKLNASSDEEHE